LALNNRLRYKGESLTAFATSSSSFLSFSLFPSSYVALFVVPKLPGGAEKSDQAEYELPQGFFDPWDLLEKTFVVPPLGGLSSTA
jgi:hypothetical protein